MPGAPTLLGAELILTVAGSSFRFRSLGFRASWFRVLALYEVRFMLWFEGFWV